MSSISLSILVAILMCFFNLLIFVVDAENKCETEMNKEFFGDCQSSGDHPPEECKAIGVDYKECLARGCAKECKEKGGDEVYSYAKSTFQNGDYDNYICCKSKTQEQAQKSGPTCSTKYGQCELVSKFFPDTTTPAPTTTTPTTTTEVPTTTTTAPTDFLSLLQAFFA